MPFFNCAPYRCPLLLRGEHIETIAPNLSRRRFSIRYRRERVELSDGDFIDLDTSVKPGTESSDTCVLVLHGLEGSSTAPYVKSLAKALRPTSWDLVAMNMRGCSDELNRTLRFYHSGETGDLREALAYLGKRYRRVFLFGFSLGGNVVLKYMGEDSSAIHPSVKGAVAVSAPVDLEGSAMKIGEPDNRFYMRRFIRLLSEKVEAKAKVYPEELDAAGVRDLQSFHAFDGKYTAPLNGFASAQDYWRKCSALNWLQDIAVPTLLINARNDPFLSPACFPETVVQESSALYSIYPDRGGHLGFPAWRKAGRAWHESVALEFLESL